MASVSLFWCIILWLCDHLHTHTRSRYQIQSSIIKTIIICDYTLYFWYLKKAKHIGSLIVWCNLCYLCWSMLCSYIKAKYSILKLEYLSFRPIVLFAPLSVMLLSTNISIINASYFELKFLNITVKKCPLLSWAFRHIKYIFNAPTLPPSKTAWFQGWGSSKCKLPFIVSKKQSGRSGLCHITISLKTHRVSWKRPG